MARGALLYAGSSPHVRGALARFHFQRGAYGIIPACAGSTMYLSQTYSGHWDHPRMCGEHPPSIAD